MITAAKNAQREDLRAILEKLRRVECYLGLKIAEDGSQIVGVMPMIYTVAIVYGVDEWGNEGRFCYETAVEAAGAFVEWSGNQGTEPTGWLRHPESGRCRPEGDAGKEYVRK